MKFLIRLNNFQIFSVKHLGTAVYRSENSEVQANIECKATGIARRSISV